jgi:hypothetical protein
MDVDAISQMNEGKKRQNAGCTLFARLLATGSAIMAKRMGNEGLYILARRPFLYFFGDWLHSVSGRSGSCSSRREKRKVSSKVSSQAIFSPTNHLIQPT